MARIQGRLIGSSELEAVRQLIAENPRWSRRRLSQALSSRWDWRNGTGQLKDMAARSLLLKLQDRGLIELPARRQAPTNRMGLRQSGGPEWEQTPVEDPLSQLQPLRVEEVSGDQAGRALVASALGRFHYLGYGGTVGQNLQYVVRQRQGRPLAMVVFGSPAWKCAARDRFIGWKAAQRERNLHLLTNNTRFLILPWVRVAHLASWILAQVVGRLSRDWQAKYGHGIGLVETFVERERFAGTSYRAANWRHVGATTGRTRQDVRRCIQAPVKEVYLYPLRKDFRAVLQA